MHMFGGKTKRAVPIRVATADGTPTGLSPPTVRTVSDSQLRLFWFPPVFSNGQILRYIVYVDDEEVKNLKTSADGSPITSFANEGDYSTIISNLRPYQVHTLILGACTKFACGNSSEISVTTVEIPPKDQEPPTIVSRGSTWLAIRFNPPESPNGLILRYDLFRKSTDHCPFYRSTGQTVEHSRTKRSLELPEPINGNSANRRQRSGSKTCDYVICPVGYRQCGGVCYASNSSVTCCRGELFHTKLNHVCCDSNYVPIGDTPLHLQECCGGRLHKRVEGNQCCFGNYVAVPSGSTCCYNTIQRNVIVSLGDSCCSSLPYRPEEYSQVCFGGVLLNRPEQKPCGRRLITSSKVCCASSTKMDAETDSSEPLPDHECCGGRYYNKSSEICCSNGRTSNLFKKDSDLEMSCCGSNLIPSELSCCNGKPYNRKSGICADTAWQSLDTSAVDYHNCGRGTVCPIGASAMCDVCDFPTADRVCLIEKRPSIPEHFKEEMTPSGWPKDWNGPLLAPLGAAPTDSLNSWCVPKIVRIYSNQTVAVVNDTFLNPYTRYEYFVQVKIHATF